MHGIIDRARKEQRAHQRAHQMGHADAIHFRIRAQTQRRAEAVDVLRKAPRVSRACRAREPRHVGCDGDHHAARAAIVAMASGEVAIDKKPRPIRRLRQGRNALEIRHRCVEGRRAGFGHELGLVAEVRVEAAMRETRPPHHLVDPRLGHPAFAKRLARRFENSAACSELVFGRVTHGRG